METIQIKQNKNSYEANRKAVDLSSYDASGKIPDLSSYEDSGKSSSKGYTCLKFADTSRGVDFSTFPDLSSYEDIRLAEFSDSIYSFRGKLKRCLSIIRKSKICRYFFWC